MDVTAMLNTASMAAAMEPKLELIHERKDSSDEDLTDSVQTPSATTGDSTAPSSMAATPLEKTPSRRSSDSRAPNRNRTPWDAGGYSLSMALDNTKKLVQTSPGIRHVLPSSLTSTTPTGASTTTLHESMDLAATAPGGSTSPRHKFSDSRSSFSSAYTNASSTNNSVAHSRISSLSTVSENQPLSNLIADFSLLETRISEPCIGGIPGGLGQGQGHQHQLKLQQYSFAKMQASLSQEGDGETERLNFEPESPTPVRARHDMSIGASPEPSPRSPGRAQSPSDAMLIQRTGQTEETEYFQNFQNPSRLQIPVLHQRSQSRGDFLQPNSSPTRRHKRAVSAPDFPSIGTSSFNPRFPTFGPIPEPTPSPSQHSDGNLMEHESASSSPTGPERSRATPDGRAASSEFQPHSSSSGVMAGTLSASPMNMSPPGLASASHQSHLSISSISGQAPNSQNTTTELPANLEIASICMYRGDCQTGSQLRKAISHIFGRNKLCTRMIPTGVWVHYCRKHYQRTRYRNGGEYPQRQIGLVQEQVRRVQAWSDANAQQNRGPVLKDWSLSVRKREQMRLDSKLAGNGKKRPFHEEGVEDEEENFDDERAEMSGTAVPEWVVAQIGDGFSTAGILNVVERLKSDIDQGRLQQIPDIEILPNIVTDGNSDEPASNNTAKKTYTKRRTASSSGFAAGGHRRSQSVNTSALHSDSIPMARRSSQPNNYLAPSGRPFASDYHLQPPMEKRQRVDGEGMSMGHQHHHSLGGMSDRFEPPMASRPGFNGRMQLAHRPAFAGIRESHAESQTGYYRHEEQQHHQQQRYGGGSGDFYAHQRPMPETTPTQSGYGTDRRYAHDFEARREHERHHSTPGGSGPSDAAYGVLPAPNPQRFGGTPVAQQLEASPYVLNSATAATRRTNIHQRSQSEAGFMHHSSSHYGRPTSSGSHAPPQVNAPSRLPTNATSNNGGNYAEQVPRTTGYPSYSTHQSHASQHAGASAHPVYYGHSHSHSMSHGPTHDHHHHTHSYSGSQQEHSGGHYGFDSPNRYAEDDRRGGLSNTQQHHQQQHQQHQQPRQPQPPAPAPAPAAAPSQSFDKFENVQLPPLQGFVQSPPATTTTTTMTQHVPTLDTGASAPPTAATQLGSTEGADRHLQPLPPSSTDYPGHSRHQSSPAVTRILAPTMEANNTAAPPPYIKSVAHSVSPMPQPQDTC